MPAPGSPSSDLGVDSSLMVSALLILPIHWPDVSLTLEFFWQTLLLFVFPD